jgi:hypothetical protein
LRSVAAKRDLANRSSPLYFDIASLDWFDWGTVVKMDYYRIEAEAISKRHQSRQQTLPRPGHWN